MINILKAEFIKERRTTNAKLKFLVPVIFVLFNGFMVNTMGESPSGKSYIMATSFNWYPVMILPIVLSLLVVNILGKEKEEHIALGRRLHLSAANVFLSKNTVVIVELLIILLLSSLAIYFVGVNIFHDEIYSNVLIMATVCLFIGSLPVIALSFLLYKVFQQKIPIILLNFILTFSAALIAPTAYWKLFPWAYSLRILTPVIGVHPNGTFLESGSPLMQMNTMYHGLLLSLVVYVLISAVTLLIERRRSHV